MWMKEKKDVSEGKEPHKRYNGRDVADSLLTNPIPIGKQNTTDYHANNPCQNERVIGVVGQLSNP